MAGISDGLLRLSIGLKHLDDLIAGMKKGLAHERHPGFDPALPL